MPTSFFSKFKRRPRSGPFSNKRVVCRPLVHQKLLECSDGHLQRKGGRRENNSQCAYVMIRRKWWSSDANKHVLINFVYSPLEVRPRHRFLVIRRELMLSQSDWKSIHNSIKHICLINFKWNPYMKDDHFGQTAWQGLHAQAFESNECHHPVSSQMIEKVHVHFVLSILDHP